MSFINFNGKLVDQHSPIIPANNRGLRYGDGLFETMKIWNGEIRHWELHHRRLFNGLSKLGFNCPKLFHPAYLLEEINKLASKNKVERKGRIRLNVFRGAGGLYDPENLHPQFTIEASELPEQYTRLNENGLIIDIFPEARKSCDQFSALKHNNFLPYTMAALYAKEQRLNDCLVLNQYGRIADSTIANIFCIKNGSLFTPSLEEGPVAGTMREFLMNQCRADGYKVIEQSLGEEELLTADEVFLSNAAYGIRWVGRFREKTYQAEITTKIYQRYLQTKD